MDRLKTIGEITVSHVSSHWLTDNWGKDKYVDTMHISYKDDLGDHSQQCFVDSHKRDKRRCTVRIVLGVGNA